MIYKIVLDGTNIYGQSKDMALISPALSAEMNAAGSLSFTMPPCHKYYDSPEILHSNVEVYEEDELIWYGRVIELGTEMNNDKTVNVEGAFAYFNDSVIRPDTLTNSSTHAVFNYIIDTHNDQVPERRHFTIGEISVSDISVSYEFDYDSSLDALKSLRDTFGGNFYFRKDGGVNFIDWHAGYPYYGSQKVQFGVNLIDMQLSMRGDTIRTAILPLGKEVDGERVTIRSVNNGLDYLDSDAVETLGRIIEVVEFNEIETATELLEAARDWLEEHNTVTMNIDCSAAEMHYLDPSVPPFRLGYKERVISPPHNIDYTLPITKLDINLDSASKQISIGDTIERRITDIRRV